MLFANKRMRDTGLNVFSMTNDHNDIRETPAPVRLQVDRARAMVRGLWRLGVSILIIFLLVIWQRNLNWELLWHAHRATFLALSVFFLGLAAIAAVLLIICIRWLLLACWTAELGIEISSQTVSLKLGPFGRRTYDWSDIEMGIEQDFDVELLDRIPDDAIVTFMRHPDSNEDLLLRVQRFAGLETERLTSLMRPYLKWTSSEISGR